MKQLVKRLTDLVFDPLWERFGRADHAHDPELERFRRERDRWVTQAKYQRRWEEGRRRD